MGIACSQRCKELKCWFTRWRKQTAVCVFGYYCVFSHRSIL